MAGKLTANKVKRMGNLQLSKLLASFESEVSANPDNIKAKRAVNVLDGELRNRNKSASDPLTFGKL